MIYSLTGRVLKTTPDMIVIECGGVGYACKTTLYSVSEVQGRETATLYTYLAVREDAIDLFGFASEEELDCFKLLTSVSGVGSKYALAILSSLTPDRAALAIASEDVKAFTQVKGVGIKIAQRIVMELKDKIAKDYAYIGGRSAPNLGGISKPPSNVADAIAALTVLGYSQSEAASCLGRMDASLPVDELIRRALRELSGGKF